METKLGCRAEADVFRSFGTRLALETHTRGPRIYECTRMVWVINRITREPFKHPIRSDSGKKYYTRKDFFPFASRWTSTADGAANRIESKSEKETVDVSR